MRCLSFWHVGTVFGNRHKQYVSFRCQSNECVILIVSNVVFLHGSTNSTLNTLRPRQISQTTFLHDDIIKWRHFPRYWPFVRRIHRGPVDSPHKGQWRGALMMYLICVSTNGWVNNRDAGDLRRHHAHYDVTVMKYIFWKKKDIWISVNSTNFCSQGSNSQYSSR